VLTLFVYRANAYRVFPKLRLSTELFTRARLKEVTQFSVFMLVIDWANKLNFSVDAIVIGAFLDTSAVALWAIGQRLADATQRLTNQLNDVLFPNVVDHDEAARVDRLQAIFLVATRLSLATVIPLGAALGLMAGPLVMAWVGPSFSPSVIIVQLLAVTVVVRVGIATASTVLKGAGRHRFLAWNNLLTAIANLLLSVALVRPLGITGVAVGTLIPVSISSLLFVFPAGCRRVGVGVTRALLDAVWPAVWPAALMAAFVAATRSFVPATLPAVALEIFLSVAIYTGAFLAFGVRPSERRLCIANAQAWLSRGRPMPPPVSEVA